MTATAVTTALVLLAVVLLAALMAAIGAARRNRREYDEDLWRAAGLVSEAHDERDLLQTELTLERELTNKLIARADRLVAQVWELRRELGLPARVVHTKCFDAWHDGGSPCADCQSLLGVRGG